MELTSFGINFQTEEHENERSQFGVLLRSCLLWCSNVSELEQVLWEQEQVLWEQEQVLWEQEQVLWEQEQVLWEQEQVLWELEQVLWEHHNFYSCIAVLDRIL